MTQQTAETIERTVVKGSMRDSKWVKKWIAVSSSHPGTTYVVAQDHEGNFACACIGWTRHMPRTDCKHIRGVYAYEARRGNHLAPDERQGIYSLEEYILARMNGRV